MRRSLSKTGLITVWGPPACPEIPENLEFLLVLKCLVKHKSVLKVLELLAT